MLKSHWHQQACLKNIMLSIDNNLDFMSICLHLTTSFSFPFNNNNKKESFRGFWFSILLQQWSALYFVADYSRLHILLSNLPLLIVFFFQYMSCSWSIIGNGFQKITDSNKLIFSNIHQITRTQTINSFVQKRQMKYIGHIFRK